MTTTPVLSHLERTVLELVERGGGSASWHDIATRLSALDVERTPDPLTVLKRLQALGLVVRVHREQGSDHWAVTARGAGVVRAGPAPAAPGAPLGGDALHGLVQALGGSTMDLVAAIRPLIDDTPRFEAALRQALTEAPAVAEGVAMAALYLPESHRAGMARALAEDPRPAVRQALFRAWAPPRMEVQGQAWRSLPPDAWTALLTDGLTDEEPEVREHATSLVFGTAWADNVSEHLLANLARGDARLRWRTILALGSAGDPGSLAALRGIALGANASEAAAAVRALAARPDGRSDWWRALQVASGAGAGPAREVRDAAVFALAHVVEQLAPDELAWLAEPARPADVGAALAAHRARVDGGEHA